MDVDGESRGTSTAAGYCNPGTRKRPCHVVDRASVCFLCKGERGSHAIRILRHVERLRNHWGGQDDFSTFHEVALKSLEQRCGKHFDHPIYLLAKALSPDANLSCWSSQDRQQLMDCIPTYCMAVLAKVGHDGPGVLPQLEEEMGRWVHRSGSLSVPNPVPEPMAYWQRICLAVPFLGCVAVTVFSINPSRLTFHF